MVGRVKSFDSRRGYGFIIGNDGHEYFVHYQDIAKNGFKILFQGEKVTFDCIQEAKGRAAYNVKETNT